MLNYTAQRDAHLFGPGPKRILSLDGGGTRGAISIAFLERLESVLSEVEGRPVLLGEWFDLIGGTSTGAIIAAALALGYSASQIHSFYSDFGPRVFSRPLWRIGGLWAKFSARHLVAELEALMGARTLDSSDLRTGLCIVTKRLDTGSVWMLMNNPRLPYWETPEDEAYVGNRHYRLSAVVRASAAAPYYFDPEFIRIGEGVAPGLFVDGAVTPYNNPAFCALMAATLPQYGLHWPVGPENMTVVSVGTGAYRFRLDKLPFFKTLGVAAHALSSQMSDSQQLTQLLMSWLGTGPTAWPINSEIGDLAGLTFPGGAPLFRYLRYDLMLEKAWLAENVGVSLDDRTLDEYRQIDSPKSIPAIYQLGSVAAQAQVRAEHFR